MTSEFCLFDTAIGKCGIGWRQRDKSCDVTQFQLPEDTPEETAARIAREAGAVWPSIPPPSVAATIKKVQKHLAGDTQRFNGISLDLNGTGEFAQAVYAAAQEIPSGQTRTYGELARAVGQPGAAQAVGQALGSNPIPLIVPCHRILAAGGKPGGFSAHGGRSTKATLLAIEGVTFGPHPTIRSAKDLSDAVTMLRYRDPVLANCLTGSLDFQMRSGLSPYAALFEAIVHQQLSTKVVTAILGRVKGLYAGSVIPEPEDLLKTPDQLLREAGLSGAKTAALKDLAVKALDGTVPGSKEIVTLGDEEIVRRLTGVRGVGRWTVEMLLIFNLGRSDIFPVDDLVIRKAYAQLYGLDETPTAKALLPLGDGWKPYRTVASLYLWESMDPQVVERNEEMLGALDVGSLF